MDGVFCWFETRGSEHTTCKGVAGDPTVIPVSCRRRRRKVSPLARKGAQVPSQGACATIERTDFESRRAHQKKQSKGCFFFCDFRANSVLYGIGLHHIMHIFRFYSRQLLCSETTLGKLFPTISDKFDSYKTVIWVPKTVKNS